LLPHDTATWLAIAALILAVPLSVVGNLLTPILRNWWAQRSVASLQKRIAELEGLVSDMGKNTPLSEVEEAILLTLRNGVAIASVVVLVAVTEVYIHVANSAPHTWLSDVTWSGLYVVVIVIAVGAAQFIIGPSLDVLRRRSSTRKKEMQRDIEELKAKLARKNPHATSTAAEGTGENARPILLSADYGADGYRWIDVKPVLNGRVKDGRLCIQVTNEELGSDPVPNVKKKLRVVYLLNGRDHHLEVAEGEKLSIPGL
jgi:hypothetical protein